MYVKLICVINIIFATTVLSRHVPDINELDEEEQMLFRAAYDSPSSYNQYQYDDEPEGKLDLLKDGMWALKSKFIEMKAIEKALAANMLSSKLKLKELLADKMKLLKPLKKPIHVEVDQKPTYTYQAPSSYPQYQPQKTYAAPAQYSPPAQQYASPGQQYAPHAQQYAQYATAYQYAPVSQHYSPPAQHYAPPAHQYTAPAQQYTAPAQQYTAPAQQYTAPAQQYTAPAQQYTAPAQQYTAPAQQYASAPQHDPYYGH